MTELPVGEIICGDCLDIMRGWPDNSVDCCVTSPPYWGLRDYGVDGQLGLERTPQEYIAAMVAVFEEVRRVLKPTGTLWLNVGDSYASSGTKSNNNGTGSSGLNHGRGGSNYEAGVNTQPPVKLDFDCKPKDLVMIPARLALALQDAGWWLRSDIIWAKPNPMPESVTDRPTSAHEHIFLLAKSERYYYDAAAIAEQGAGREIFGNSRRLNHADRNDCDRRNMTLTETRNARNVWTITTQPYPGAHFATFPPELPRRCILAGCQTGGVVLDPFFGSGTVGMVAQQLARQFIGIELNPDYCAIARKRTAQKGLDFMQDGDIAQSGAERGEK